MELNQLREIGFSQGEVSVYEALLELGKSKTGEISKRSGVHNSKVYPILERLIQKGLVSYIIRNNIRYYQITDPHKLISYIHIKKERLSEQEDEIRKIIPRIIEKQKLFEDKPSAEVYEGKEGVNTIFEITLEEWKKGEDYFVLAPGTEYLKSSELNDFFFKHHLKRIEKGIKVKLIALKSQRDFFKKYYETQRNYDIRYTDFVLPASINITKNRVITTLWTPIPTAFAINSLAVAGKYKNFFKEIWKVAKNDF
ncbi:helix-turn-helix domain-containing protein [Candidatus Pacearchaeota archaeon]|nr:helix-turn-helix domain-containing protein [Candidatus Pacearchaeota archaeon]